MKSFFLFFCLMLSFGSITFAQQADLSAYVNFPQYECLNKGDSIVQDNTNMPNEPIGIWGVINNGPDVVDSGQTVWISSPYNVFNVNGDSLLYFFGFPTRHADVNDYVELLSFIQVDSIHTLLDIDSFENDTTGLFIHYMVSSPNFVDSQVYGFFTVVHGIGDNFDQPDNLDTNKSNNLAYVPIVWECGNNNPSGIKQMLVDGAKTIQIFPNPAQGVLHFRYGFLKHTDKAVAQVVSLTGRVLQTQNLGSHNFGTEEFQMNVSTLPPGNYILRIETGYITATGKFTVRK